MQQEPILIVMAAGMGSRFGGLKQIEPVTGQGEMILDFSVYDALRAGFQRVVFVINRTIESTFSQVVGDHLARQIRVDYVFQDVDDLPDGCQVPAGRTKPWGTGQAILAARHLIDGPFVVINADDFYGAVSLGLLFDHLSHHPDTECYEYAMIGYPIHCTISEHGHVSRGICQTDGQNNLINIVERTHIEKRPAGIAWTEDEGTTWHSLPEDTTVSMNLWGFNVSFMAELERSFRDFLSGLPAAGVNPLKAEFYLNAVVNRLLQDGQAKVNVLPTSDHWFGVTYQSDKPEVVAALAELKIKGVYPESLWGA